MSARHYRKSDVQMHSPDRHGREYPAVNVRADVRFWAVELPLDLGSCDGVEQRSDPSFTHDWIAAHVTDDQMQAAWQCVCDDGWEQIEDAARDLFGPAVPVYAAGRSGGWAVVVGLDPVESWDAIALGRWARFERFCRAGAYDVPRAMIESIYYNIFCGA